MNRPALAPLAALLLLAACAAPAPKTTAVTQPTATEVTPSVLDVSPAPGDVGAAAARAEAAEEKVLETPEQAKQRAKREQEIHLSLVNKMIAQRNEYAALAHLDSYDRKWGASFDSKRLRADCLRRTKQLDQAETLYKSILGQQTNARIWYGLGKVSIERNDLKNAAVRLEKAIQVDPLMVEGYADLGLIYLLEGKQDESYNTLMKATQLSANDQSVLANLALWGLVYQDFELAKGIADRLKWSEKTRTQVLNQANAIRKKFSGG